MCKEQYRHVLSELQDKLGLCEYWGYLVRGEVREKVSIDESIYSDIVVGEGVNHKLLSWVMGFVGHDIMLASRILVSTT